MNDQEDMSNKCYKCVFGRKLPMATHFECNHVEAQKWKSSSKWMHHMMECMVKKQLPNTYPLNIEAHETGLKGNYFHWPYNFDPLWLKSCTGFKEEPSYRRVDK
jgi:hypothetical protein